MFSFACNDCFFPLSAVRFSCLHIKRNYFSCILLFFNGKTPEEEFFWFKNKK